MKKLLIAICLILIICPNLAFSEMAKDKLTPRAPNADIWDRFDIAYKSILIGGLLVGYRSGIATGVASEHRRMKKDTEISRIEAKKLNDRAKSIFHKPVSFYVAQTDSFLRQNPVCKKVQITRLLEELAHVWISSALKKNMGYTFIEEINYKNVEKVCLEWQPSIKKEKFQY